MLYIFNKFNVEDIKVNDLTEFDENHIEIIVSNKNGTESFLEWIKYLNGFDQYECEKTDSHILTNETDKLKRLGIDIDDIYEAIDSLIDQPEIKEKLKN